jgi:hypothetical protein
MCVHVYLYLSVIRLNIFNLEFSFKLHLRDLSLLCIPKSSIFGAFMLVFLYNANKGCFKATLEKKQLPYSSTYVILFEICMYSKLRFYTFVLLKGMQWPQYQTLFIYILKTLYFFKNAMNTLPCFIPLHLKLYTFSKICKTVEVIISSRYEKECV